MRRKEKRERIEKESFQQELLKTIKHFFPRLFEMLNEAKDPRDKRKIKYEMKIILFMPILSLMFSIESMRRMTEEFNKTQIIKNIRILLGGEDDKEEVPYWETINNCLKRLKPRELEKIRKKLVNHLIRMRTFESSRIEEKYWQILIDGTGWFSTTTRHCEHCLTREHKDKDGNIKYIEYYHYILEAKLVLPGDIVISIATEFVENESPDVKKQDCESNAFNRLAKELKKQFPKLPICITADSLYASQTFFDICKKNKWKYIVRFKEGSIPSIAEEFESLKDYNNENIYRKNINNVKQIYKFVNDISYHDHLINEIEYEEENDKGEKTKFNFITNIRITAKNHERIVAHGRDRWDIENQGFNTQKNHGYNMQHLYSHDFNAMKNYYFLMQIAHMIFQIFENTLFLLKTVKMSDKHLHQLLLIEFQTKAITQSDLDKTSATIHVAFARLNYTTGEVVIAR